MIDNESAKWSNNPQLNNQMEQLLGSPKGYFGNTEEYKADHKPKVNTDDRINEIREIVFAWVRDDVPVEAKLVLKKEHVDLLVNKIIRDFK